MFYSLFSSKAHYNEDDDVLFQLHRVSFFYRKINEVFFYERETDINAMKLIMKLIIIDKYHRIKVKEVAGK